MGPYKQFRDLRFLVCGSLDLVDSTTAAGVRCLTNRLDSSRSQSANILADGLVTEPLIHAHLGEGRES